MSAKTRIIVIFFKYLKLVSYWLINMKKPEILAVHKRDLKEFLEKLGLWELFSRGELKCRFCNTVIDFHNIGFVFPHENEVLVCCSGIECTYRYGELKRSTPL